jgi:hypothetical protein
MQQVFDGVRALVRAGQHRRLAVRELERLRARVVLTAGAIEILDRRAVLATVDPAVPGPELESGEGGVGLQRRHRGGHLPKIEAVQPLGLLHYCVHGRSPPGLPLPPRGRVA